MGTIRKGENMNQVLVYTIFSFMLTACGGSGGSDVAANLVPSTPAQQPINGGGQTVGITVFTMTQNLSVTQSGHTYPVTVTGACVQYSGVDYCWDDGWQTNASLVNYETDFWGLCVNNGTIMMCSGGTTTDPVATPHDFNSMVAYMPTPLHHPSDVYTQGTGTTLNCSMTGSVIDCVDFQIDTANASL